MRILFLFAYDWNREIADFERGKVPAHRLFGYAEVRKLGAQPSVCPTPRFLTRWLCRPLQWRIYEALFATLRQHQFDCIFAVNEASAMPALVLKRLGLLRTPIIVFCTGLMHPRNREGFRGKLWRWLLPCAEAVVSQTSMELETTWQAFGLRQDRQFYMPMLVDVNTFTPTGRKPQGDYVLAAGTNQGRDYPTLLQALPPGEKLIIVTDPYNAEIVERHRSPGVDVQVLQAIPITELKALYENAKAVVNPLVETPYCSGHTVLLENMALGRPVLISSVGGMRDYFDDGVTAIGVKPNDVDDLRQKLTAYLNDPEQFAHIGQAAAQWVRRFSCEEFAVKMIQIAGQITHRPAPEPACVATAQ